MSLHQGLSRSWCLFSNINIYQLCCKNLISKRLPEKCSNLLICKNYKFHTSCVQNDLMEFFDDKENWGALEVKVGRAWKKEELRIKSNVDLHKLWFVLLKERNMLLTMQHECNDQYVAFPNPERIYKVEESMENLESVVRERNRAYFELETGKTGERPVGEETNCFGLPYKFRMRQFPIPKEENGKFHKDYRLYNYTDDHKYVSQFLIKLNEKKRRMANYAKWKRYQKVCGLLKRFENIDEEALKEEYPDIDIEKAKRDKASRGNRLNAY